MMLIGVRVLLYAVDEIKPMEPDQMPRPKNGMPGIQGLIFFIGTSINFSCLRVWLVN